MSQGAKKLAAMRRNPQDDWHISDVASVCRAYGIDCSAPSSGSHYTISHNTQAEILTIPSRKPIKPVYIRKLVAFLDAVARSQSHG
jgi:hypothetical protein